MTFRVKLNFFREITVGTHGERIKCFALYVFIVAFKVTHDKFVTLWAGRCYDLLSGGRVDDKYTREVTMIILLRSKCL
jgi:hypothetical protein